MHISPMTYRLRKNLEDCNMCFKVFYSTREFNYSGWSIYLSEVMIFQKA